MDCSSSSEFLAISVILPARNEVANLKRLLPQLAELNPRPEIIVAEAGSSDQTRAVARELDAVVSSSLTGRGPQLNAGAALASGEVFLFLHADSILPPSSWQALLHALKDPGLEGGAFEFSLKGTRGFWPRVYEFFVGIRAHSLSLPYGDQGFFVRRKTWERIGPFQAIPLMEDVEWWGRLSRQARVEILRAPLITSPRRFQHRGWLASAARNLSLVLAWKLGISPRRIAQWYG